MHLIMREWAPRLSVRVTGTGDSNNQGNKESISYTCGYTTYAKLIPFKCSNLTCFIDLTNQQEHSSVRA